MPLDMMVIFLNLASIFSIIHVTTPGSVWDIFVSSTYHSMVHCLPLTVQFAMHEPWGLSSKPSSLRVLLNSADFMQP